MVKILGRNRLVKMGTIGMLFSIILLFLVPGPVNSAEVIDRIVAAVNGDIILLTELNWELKSGAAGIKAKKLPADKEEEELSNYRKLMLDQLINQVLIDQEIKRHGISVADEEVDQSIAQLREGKHLSEEQFKEEVKKNLGLSLEEYREKVKEQLLRMKLVNSEVQSKVVVTDEDRKLYYDQFEEKYAGGKKYHLRNIIMAVPSEAGEEEKQTILNKMEGVLTELKQGASFPAIADKYSESSASGEGGDLGFFRFTDLSPQLQDALKELKEGELTPIIDTERGYQILYVEKIEDDTGKSLEEASPDIDQQIYNASVQMKFQSWLMDLRKRSHIKISE